MKQPEEIRKTYPGLEALSVEELDDLLQEEFLLSDQDGPDTDLIQAILAEIQIKEGTTTPSEEAQASLEAFFADQDQREAAPEEPTVIPFPHKPKKERTHHRKRWLPSVVAAACLVCFLCAPVAHGSTALESMINWKTSTFSIPKGEEPTGAVAVMTDPDYLEMLYTLQLYTDDSILPHWYPDGAKVEYVESYQLDTCLGYSVGLIDGDQRFSIGVELLLDKRYEGNTVYEKNPGSGEVKYTKKGMPYYTMKNVERNVAIWKIGDAECHISGYVSERDIEHMIESIDMGDE